MSIQRTFSIFLFFVSVLTSAGAFAGSNAGHLFSDKKNDSDMFARRDVQEAVNGFCVALSLAPAGNSVRAKLNAILAHPGLTSQERADVLLFEDLLTYIGSLQRRIDYLIPKRNLLRDQLVQNGFDEKMISNDLLTIEDGLFRSTERFSYQRPSTFGRGNSLVLMNFRLQEEKMALSDRLRTLQDQSEWLKTIKRNDQYASPLAFARAREMPDRSRPVDVVQLHPPRSPGVEPNVTEKEEAVVLPAIAIGEKISEEKRFEEFKKELGSLYVQLDELEERVGKENGKIDDLAKQVVDLSLKLSETEIALEEKVQTIASLKGRFTDVEERFLLGQRIIQEKDAEIQSLQQDAKLSALDAKVQKEKLNDVITSKNKHLAELEGFLEIYRENLLRSRMEMREKAEILDQTKKELDILHEKIVREPDAIKNEAYAKGLDRTKDGTLDELSGILEIYKGQLSDKTKVIKKNRQEITMLERQLRSMEEDLKKKHQELVETRRDMRDLED